MRVNTTLLRELRKHSLADAVLSVSRHLRGVVNNRTRNSLFRVLRYRRIGLYDCWSPAFKRTSVLHGPLAGLVGHERSQAEGSEDEKRLRELRVPAARMPCGCR